MYNTLDDRAKKRPKRQTMNRCAYCGKRIPARLRYVYREFCNIAHAARLGLALTMDYNRTARPSTVIKTQGRLILRPRA